MITKLIKKEQQYWSCGSKLVIVLSDQVTRIANILPTYSIHGGREQIHQKLCLFVCIIILRRIK